MKENWELLTKIANPEDDKPELDTPQLELISDFSPQGDQPQAIDKLIEGAPTRRQSTDAPRRDGFRKNLHDGECDSARPIAHARNLAQ